jgi:hypothetical protein
MAGHRVRAARSVLGWSASPVPWTDPGRSTGPSVGPLWTGPPDRAWTDADQTDRTALRSGGPVRHGGSVRIATDDTDRGHAGRWSDEPLASIAARRATGRAASRRVRVGCCHGQLGLTVERGVPGAAGATTVGRAVAAQAEPVAGAARPATCRRVGPQQLRPRNTSLRPCGLGCCVCSGSGGEHEFARLGGFVPCGSQAVARNREWVR